MGPARRLARRRAQLALRAGVAVGASPASSIWAFSSLPGEWRSLLFRPRDVRPAAEMQLYYLRLRREHPPQGKHNALQKAAYTGIVVVGALAVLSGFAIYKPVQLGWLTALFGGYELARYWHFVTVWIFVGFTLLHVVLVFTVDPASLRGMITGWYRGGSPAMTERGPAARPAGISSGWGSSRGPRRWSRPAVGRRTRTGAEAPDVQPAQRLGRREGPLSRRRRLAPELPGVGHAPRCGTFRRTPSPTIAAGSFPELERPRRLDARGRRPGPKARSGLTRQMLESLPARRYTVKHHCVEGWTAIGTWTGVPVSRDCRGVEPLPDARYLRFDSFDSDYYNGWDLASAMHPQTILAYAYERPPVDSRARRAAAALLADQAGLQDDQVPAGGDASPVSGRAGTGRTRGIPGSAGV